MLFLLCAIALLMLLVPFAAGIFAGPREGKRPFFVTLGGVVLFELAAILIVLPARDALKGVLFCLQIHEVLPAAGVPALAGIVLFLLAWNCRRNSAAAWKGILWGIAFFLFGGVFFLPLSAALAALVALFTVPRGLPVLGIMYGTVLWGLLGESSGPFSPSETQKRISATSSGREPSTPQPCSFSGAAQP